MKLYVASSWSNPYQQETVKALREWGHEVYDFREPANGSFRLTDTDPNWQLWNIKTYHRIWADACVLVLPSGRLEHLEAGWFAGQNKPIWVLAPEPIEPEIMQLSPIMTTNKDGQYHMIDGIVETLPELKALIANRHQFRGME